MQYALEEASGVGGTPPSRETEVTPRLLAIFHHAAAWIDTEVQHTLLEAGISSAAHETGKCAAPCCPVWHYLFAGPNKRVAMCLSIYKFFVNEGTCVQALGCALRISASRLR